MKLIKRVESKPKDRFVQFDCPCCGSRLEERLSAMGTTMYRNEEYYTFVCPVCHELCGVDEGQIAEVGECTDTE